jgi:hypothetical protein
MTDALTWLANRTRKPLTRRILAFFFGLPILKGVVNRITEGGGGFLDDFEAVQCAGRLASQGAVYYGADANCPDISGHTTFVYAPWAAEGAGAIMGAVGQMGFVIGYVALYLIALGFLAFQVFFSRSAPGRLVERLLFLGLITGSAVVLGNVAIPLLALVLAGALMVTGSVFPLALALGISGAFKPVLLTFGVVFLLAPISWARRIFGGVLALVLALAPWAWSYHTGGAQWDAWVEITRFMAVERAPGDGFWGWLAVFGVSGTAPGAIAGYLAYAGALTLLGWAVAARAGLSARERVWMGLALGTLLIPRLMAIDVYLLAPGMIALIFAARAGAPGVFRAVSWLVVGGCFLGLLFDLVDLGDFALKTALLAFALAFVTAGVGVLRRNRNSPLAG